MLDNLRFIVVNKNGEITGMFDDKSVISTSSAEELARQVKLVEHTPSKPDDFDFLMHLYCARTYAQANYPNMELSNEDITMYYRLVQEGNIVFTVGESYRSMIFTPHEISEKQKKAIEEMRPHFNPDKWWNMSNNLYIDTFEWNGKTYGTYEIGDIETGDIGTLTNLLLKKNKVKKAEADFGA